MSVTRETHWAGPVGRIKPIDVVLVIALAIGVAIAAYLITGRFPASYDGRTTLLVGSDVQSVDSLTAATLLTQTYAELATTAPVLNAVIANVGLHDTVDQLRARVDAVPTRDTVSIVVHDPDPAAAATIANEIGKQLLTAMSPADPRIDDAQKSLLDSLAAVGADIAAVQKQLDDLSKASPTPATVAQIDALQTRLTSLQVTQATLLGQARQPGPLSIRVVEPAVVDDRPTSPRAVLNSGVALIAALVIGTGLVLLIRRPRSDAA